MMSFNLFEAKLPEARGLIVSPGRASGAKGLVLYDSEPLTDKGLRANPTRHRSKARRTNIDWRPFEIWI